MKKGIIVFTVLALCVLLGGCNSLSEDKTASMTALGNPAEGVLEPFRGEPFFEKEVVFNGDGRVREPYLAVAVDGTVLVLRNKTIGR